MLRILLTWPIHISTDLLISVLFSGTTVYSNHRTFVSSSWYSELAPHSLTKPFNYFPRCIFLFIQTDILYILCFLLSLFFSQHYSSLSLIEAKEKQTKTYLFFKQLICFSLKFYPNSLQMLPNFPWIHNGKK